MIEINSLLIRKRTLCQKFKLFLLARFLRTIHMLQDHYIDYNIIDYCDTIFHPFYIVTTHILFIYCSEFIYDQNSQLIEDRSVTGIYGRMIKPPKLESSKPTKSTTLSPKPPDKINNPIKITL